jgi:hypothetical protein
MYTSGRFTVSFDISGLIAGVKTGSITVRLPYESITKIISITLRILDSISPYLKVLILR